MAKQRSTKSKPRKRTNRKKTRRSRHDRLQQFQRNLLKGALVMLALAAFIAWAGGENGRASQWLADWRNEPRRILAAAGSRIGIVAGHLDSDSGAVCADGLTEAETVQEIADLVARRLRRAGARVDLLAEYDERLNGYRADALVSIHADACVARSGFKTARLDDSAIPQTEDALLACLNQQYADATGLTFDPYTVTEDMIGYHVFNRVASQTPAAIIETGFLGGDRELLTKRPDQAARGIADGIICFLELQNSQ